MRRRIFEFLKRSNRWKHLFGGVVVGICGLSVFCAIYSAVVAASCLELKDVLHGCRWDWVDWLLTVFGGCLSAALWLVIL